jgi:hypothetical protein
MTEVGALSWQIDATVLIADFETVLFWFLSSAFMFHAAKQMYQSASAMMGARCDEELACEISASANRDESILAVLAFIISTYVFFSLSLRVFWPGSFKSEHHYGIITITEIRRY